MLIFFQPNGTNTGQLFWSLEVILFSNLVSVFCISFLVFVHWKKGPVWWTKISHVVFFSLLITNYIIIPLANVVIAVFFILDPKIDLKTEPIESYIVFFMVICSMRLVEYFTIVRRSVVLDARIYLESKARLESLSVEQLKKELAELDESVQGQVVTTRRNALKEFLGERASYL